LLESYFTQRLMAQRQASPHTIASYRDTFRLLLNVFQYLPISLQIAVRHFPGLGILAKMPHAAFTPPACVSKAI
jgi:hypothetical protein